MKSALRIAEKNAPLERQAQAVARQMVSQKRRANPEMDKDELKKIRGYALNEARLRTGAGKDRIKLTDRQWDAIQAGAISSDMLDRILKNSDLETIRSRATPRKNTVMTVATTARAKQLLAAGYTTAEVADKLGIPVSTLKSGLK